MVKNDVDVLIEDYKRRIKRNDPEIPHKDLDHSLINDLALEVCYLRTVIAESEAD